MQLYKKIALAAAVAAALGTAPSFAQQSGSAASASRAHRRPAELERRLASHEQRQLEPRGALRRSAEGVLGARLACRDSRRPKRRRRRRQDSRICPKRSRNATRIAPAGRKPIPETTCYLPGIPRATYMPYPFQIVQGGGNILFVYSYASANRLVNMGEPISAARRHLDGPVERPLGRRARSSSKRRASTA